MHPIVIIGSGMAGYALAKEYRKLNSTADLILITADDGANYSKPMLSNALTSKRDAAQIASASAEQMAAQLNITILNHCQVSHIDPAQHRLQLEHSDGPQQLNYGKLVLAVGANPIRLAIQGDAADELYVINNLNDYHKFRTHFDQLEHARILIIGAGLIGCEFANDLRNAGEHNILLVDLATQPFARLLPEQVAQTFQRSLEDAGVRFILENTVQAIDKLGKHYQVSLSNGQQFLVDAVISAVGLHPNTALAANAGIQVSRGIITDRQLQTNIEDIYAIGDCAEVNGTLLPYVMPLMLQARALAKTLAGETTAVQYPAMPVAVKTPAAPLTFLAAPQHIDLSWKTEVLDDGMIATAHDVDGQLRAFVLLGATAAKQRLSLSKQVPDLF